MVDSNKHYKYAINNMAGYLIIYHVPGIQQLIKRFVCFLGGGRNQAVKGSAFEITLLLLLLRNVCGTGPELYIDTRYCILYSK